MANIEIDKKILAKSIVETIWLWSDHEQLRNADQNGLHEGVPFEIKEEWFRKFRGDWNLTRALIEDETKNGDINRKAIKVLNDYISSGKFASYTENSICKLSEELASACLTPNKNLQTSMASKIAFFSNPNSYVPFDRFSRNGLRALANESGSLGNVTIKSIEAYDGYMDIFCKLLGIGYHTKVEHGCKDIWVSKLMELMDVQPSCATENAFVMKVFDVYLMYYGGFANTREVEKSE